MPGNGKISQHANLFSGYSKVLDISAKVRGEILENPAIKGLSRQRADGKEVETAAYYQSGKGWEYLVKEFAEGQAKQKQEEKGS